MDMASSHCRSTAFDGRSLRLWRSTDAPARNIWQKVFLANTLLRARLDFAGRRIGLSPPRTWRATVLGAHDTARDPDVDLGAVARTRPAIDCISLGTAASMARGDRKSCTFTNLQKSLGFCFGPALGMVGVRA